jgi:hypothetical protein
MIAKGRNDVFTFDAFKKRARIGKFIFKPVCCIVTGVDHDIGIVGVDLFQQDTIVPEPMSRPEMKIRNMENVHVCPVAYQVDLPTFH